MDTVLIGESFGAIFTTGGGGIREILSRFSVNFTGEKSAREL